MVEIWPGGQGCWYRRILEPCIRWRGNYTPVRESRELPVSVSQVASNSAGRGLVFCSLGFMLYEHPVQDHADAPYEILKPGGIFGIVVHHANEAFP